MTSGSAAAPRPRFSSVPFALAFPYVKVPLMVMFPLGPQIVALYLEMDIGDVRDNYKELKGSLRAPGARQTTRTPQDSP